MTNKLIILGIAIVAIGMVALPETLALFSDQHDWYNVNSSGLSAVNPGTGVPCGKCHADVYSQMLNADLGSPHRGTGSVQGQSGFLYCEECHIISQILPGPDGKALTYGATPGASLHAAAAPQCLDCHGDAAGLGYKYPSAPDATSIFTGSVEAHKQFVNAANDSATMLKGANEACIACHTHVQVNIQWSKPTILSFNANTTVGGAWVVDNFAVSGQANVSTVGYANGSAGPVTVGP